MKKSELKAQIEEIITELLSEIDTDRTRGTAVVPLGTDPTQVKKYTDRGIDVEFRKGQMVGEAESDEEDDSPADKEPTKSELRKNAGVAKIKDELAKVTKEMKDLAKEYTKVEGDKKDKIKTQLKDLTAKKKDLEKKLDKAL